MTSRHLVISISGHGFGHVAQTAPILNLLHERQRQEYLRLHLAKVIPVLSQMEGLKEKVKLNGHFKNLSSFEFE